VDVFFLKHGVESVSNYRT